MPQLEYGKTDPSNPAGGERRHSAGLIALLLLVVAIGARGADDLLAPAEELIRQGRYVEARTELGRIAEEHRGEPSEIAATLRQNDLEQEGALYLGRLEDLYGSTNNALVLFAIGKYRYAVGAYSSAAEDFHGAARGLDEVARQEAKVWEGAALLGAGDRKGGLGLLSDVAGSSSGSKAVRDKARFLAAQALARQDDFRGSVAMAMPLTGSENDYSAPAGLLAAQSVLAAGDRKGARELFSQLIGKYPESEEASAARDALLTMGAEEATPRQSTGGGWFVQIASFKNELNARRFVAAKRSGGIGAVEMYHEVRDGESVFPIRIGPFGVEEDARTAASNLAAQGMEVNVVHMPGPETSTIPESN